MYFTKLNEHNFETVRDKMGIKYDVNQTCLEFLNARNLRKKQYWIIGETTST